MNYSPLSERLRPTTIQEIAGQDHLVGKSGILTHIIESKRPRSLLLFGPPGCGKTTLARLYAAAFNFPFIALSAVVKNVAELKRTLKEPSFFSQPSLLFVDEIHRFNRAEQDIFLPFLEDGTLVLIGATTENPSFVLNGALLSRLMTLTLHPLQESSLEQILQRYEARFSPLPLDPAARSYLVSLAQGDGRYLLNLIETIEQTGAKETLDPTNLGKILQKKPALYDKDKEVHYNSISALHKAIRGSDPDAALYWFARMLEGGEDPRFIGRRLIRVATEDVGLADPSALSLTLAACDAYERLGSPEGELALAQAVLYLALSPKSNATYTAYGAVREFASKTTHLSPPKHILNAPTSLMKEMGYGSGYQYDHDMPSGFSGQDYFPEEVGRQSFYQPVERGFEREMKKRLDYFAKMRKQPPCSNPDNAV